MKCYFIVTKVTHIIYIMEVVNMVNSTFNAIGMKCVQSNPVREIMDNPEELEKMVLEDNDSVSVIINKNFMDNDQKPIVISTNANKYMLSKKILSEKQNVIKAKTENEPGMAEVYEEIEYSNDDFYQYIEDRAKSIGMNNNEIDEIMNVLEDECPRINCTKLIKRIVTI